MNFKRLTRGPFLYIVLGLLVVLALSSGLRGDGGYKKVETATVLAKINAGDVSPTKKDPALLLDKEQQVKIKLKDGKKLQASFLIDQGRQFADAFQKNDVRYDVKVTRESVLFSILVSLLPFVGLLKPEVYAG